MLLLRFTLSLSVFLVFICCSSKEPDITEPPANSVEEIDENELLKNSNFEQFTGNVAAFWVDNSLAPASVAYAKDESVFKNGKSAQRIEIKSIGSGAVQFYQAYQFKKGVTYRARVYLKASSPMSVKVSFRRNPYPYEDIMLKIVELDGSNKWEECEFIGYMPEPIHGRLQISPLGTGILWVDQASMVEVVEIPDIFPDVSGIPVPEHYFGMHVNKLGSHNEWPTDYAGLIRLWDTGTKWTELETSKNSYNWLRMDYYVSTALNRNPEVKIMYTLGQTPRWAAKNPNLDGHGGLGAPSIPSDMEDWRNYVRTVATRYKGKIQYYEIWNETNYGGFYKGSVKEIYELTKAAYEVLKEVDPNIIVLSPNVTKYGALFLSEFLALGGGNYVDIISVHWYFGLDPEYVIEEMANFYQVLKTLGINKPIWNTEGAATYKSDSMPPDKEAIAAVSRGLLLFWAHGIGNFSWYFWENEHDHNLGLVTIMKNDYKTPTVVGLAMQDVRQWMVGNRLTTKYKQNDIHVYEFTHPNAEKTHVVWSESGNKQFNIPSEWNAFSYKKPGESSHILKGGVVEVSTIPILISSL